MKPLDSDKENYFSRKNFNKSAQIVKTNSALITFGLQAFKEQSIGLNQSK